MGFVGRIAGLAEAAAGEYRAVGAAQAEVQAAALAVALAAEVTEEGGEGSAPLVASQSKTAVVGEELSGQPGAQLGRFQ